MKREITGKDFTKLDAARSVILDNIQCGDSLKFMNDLAQRRLEDEN